MMHWVFYIILAVNMVACGRSTGDLESLYHERSLHVDADADADKFSDIEIAQSYLAAITRPLSKSEGKSEEDFFLIWNAFEKKCDLWTYIVRSEDSVRYSLMNFSVSLSVKRHNQNVDDSGKLGEQMLGSDGRLLVPVEKRNGSYVFDKLSRYPIHKKYREVLKYQNRIGQFISGVDYCFMDSDSDE